MANGLTTEVVVRRTVKDGWHVYTCNELPGLYVAHQDDRIAYQDLPQAISLLMRLDDGVLCTVSHKLSYSEFLQRVRLQEAATHNVRSRTEHMMNEENINNYLPFIIQHSARAYN